MIYCDKQILLQIKKFDYSVNERYSTNVAMWTNEWTNKENEFTHLR